MKPVNPSGHTSTFFYIQTHGCSANQSDSEIIAGILQESGFKISENIENAKLIIINTCYVKQTTENRILGRLKYLSKKYPSKKILVCGCMPDAIRDKLAKASPNAGLLSTNRIGEIKKAALALLDGGRPELLGSCRKEKAGLPRKRKNPLVGIVQISSGCLGNCSYCGTKIAKGSILSYCPESIVHDVKDAVSSGCTEIWLTSQDNACYGFDLGTDLSDLLKNILRANGKYYIRIGMLNPNQLKKIIGPLLEVCSDKRVFKFFHMPVQSGSAKVLSDMNRPYKPEAFEELVRKIRKSFPLSTIGTDLIVGYPTETKEDFEMTLELMRKTRPDWINISRYSERHGTPAEKLKPLDSSVLKKRSEIAHMLAKEIAEVETKKWIGWTGEALITEKRIGKNFAHREIILDKVCPPGKFVIVRVEKTEGTKIFGKIDLHKTAEEYYNYIFKGEREENEEHGDFFIRFNEKIVGFEVYMPEEPLARSTKELKKNTFERKVVRGQKLSVMGGGLARNRLNRVIERALNEKSDQFEDKRVENSKLLIVCCHYPGAFSYLDTLTSEYDSPLDDNLLKNNPNCSAILIDGVERITIVNSHAKHPLDEKILDHLQEVFTRQ
ncbi:MAG: tRNA (N(6)-L-threonylcarbamoyladenosine(37)-C(2))-methylthiotransferase [Candidatus Aenigmarchaeota archaeon]|nr:tRNA (N(6)-L-threonylcarbamoyladenosine(37)-C(2))-methylthiotransferase [Candidatus Aenigmarchaeota archaeon]